MAVQWITTTPISGSSGTTQVSVVPQNNTGTTTRTGTLTVTASRFGRAKTVTVNVKQEATYSFAYFTTRSLADNNTIYFNIPSVVNSTYATSISYSTDDGSTWVTTNINDTNQVVSVSNLSSGDTVIWRGTATRWIATGTSNYYSTFSSEGNYEVEGNMLSLLYGDNFSGQTAYSAAGPFARIFDSSTHLINAENLVLSATGITNQCYWFMFNGCTSLTTAPSVLPATALTRLCYCGMFHGCTSLTKTPELPATTLAYACYEAMFSGCTSLVTAPEISATTSDERCCYEMFAYCTSLTTAPSVLPATTLAEYCYWDMFKGCTSLTTAPALPATTLANYCYEGMFRRCTSLTTAPALPATTLVGLCYNNMFAGCSSLNYIKCLATDISAEKCTSNWVYLVPEGGTFEKASGVTWTTGRDGIPSGWTVVDV